MILVGWGKNAKKIADLGMAKCHNCKNYAWFEMYEVSKKVKAYFIPVAKFGVQYFAVCTVCNHGESISRDRKGEVIRQSISIPEKHQVVAIWTELSDIVDKNREELYGNGYLNENLLQAKAALLSQMYGSQNLDYVMKIFFNYITDENLPR